MVPYEEINGCIMYNFDEDIEIFRCDELRSFLNKHIVENNHRKVVFNLQDVQFVDSSGIGLFINLQFSHNERTKFRFCNVADNIRRTFEYTNLLSVFDMDASEGDSIMQLNEQFSEQLNGV